MPRKDAWITLTPPDRPLVLSERGAAFGIEGFVHGPSKRVRALRLFLVQGGRRLEAAHVSLQTGLLGLADTAGGRRIDDGLDAGFYASAVFPFDAALVDGPATVEADAVWSDGEADAVRLCAVEILRVDSLPDAGPASARRVGIAMATYNPDPALFAAQVASIQGQSHADWVCVIADDGSRPDSLRAVASAVADDPRFHVLPSARNLGFYRNFERACAALPRDCAFVALSDQDDAWRADRLARQLEALAGEHCACAYSDMQIVDPDGRVLSETFWVHRKARYGSLAGLLLGNVVTGMTVLAHRALIARALPFPATPSLTYHDHWIALLAARLGSLRYLPEPLVRYVQHGENHTGALRPAATTRAVLAQGLRRIARFAQVGLLGRRPLEVLREPHVLDWTAREPARLRILVDRLDAEVPGGDPGLTRLARRLGPLALMRCGGAWSDRYRRAYAIELGLGALLRAWIGGLARRGWLRPEAGPS